ncbi:MAG TPA: type II secretion system minor pseudopilin GspK, partial [Rhodoferax sp.]
MKSQRGAAILTAMLTVVLVASLASATLWQQWRGVEVEAAERSRMQSAWILSGALDWARLILREDGRKGGADHLAEPWAVPLEPARLSSFLAADRSDTPAADASQEAFLSGQITDLQSRLNVTNLVQGGAIDAPSELAFTRLFELLDLPETELILMLDKLRRAQPAP